MFHHEKLLVELGNVLADFAIDGMRAQLQAGKWALMEHPEDLGRCASGGVPAAIWQFPECLDLLKQSQTVTLGLLQSDFGTPYLKPTRLLGRLPNLESLGFPGLPEFDNNWNYLGPIPRSNKYTQTLAKKPNEAVFRTTGTAAWPPLLCGAIAALIAQAFLGLQTSQETPPGAAAPETRNGEVPKQSAEGVGFWGFGLFPPWIWAPQKGGRGVWEAQGVLRRRRPLLPGKVETVGETSKASRV